MALRLIEGEPCPHRRAAARAERRERAAGADPHDLRFWLLARSSGATGPQARGARGLLARTDRPLPAGELTEQDIFELIALGCALEGVPELTPEGA